MNARDLDNFDKLFPTVIPAEFKDVHSPQTLRWVRVICHRLYAATIDSERTARDIALSAKDEEITKLKNELVSIGVERAQHIADLPYYRKGS